MLDQGMKAQLKAYLENLRVPIALTAHVDDGAKSRELIDLLEDIVAASDKVSLSVNNGADAAREVTGYVRGTITPLGSLQALPVIADERVTGQVSIGGGAHGVALTLDAAALVGALGATVADVTDLTG